MGRGGLVTIVLAQGTRDAMSWSIQDHRSMTWELQEDLVLLPAARPKPKGVEAAEKDQQDATKEARVVFGEHGLGCLVEIEDGHNQDDDSIDRE
jgi:hypothetical protein